MSVRPDATGLVPTRTDKTLVAYGRRARQLLGQAKKELGGEIGVVELVYWFSDQDGRWKENTVHTYRAALRTFVTDQVVEGLLTQSAADALGDVLERKLRYKKGGPARTSAKKATSYRVEDFARLVNALGRSQADDDRLAAQILSFNVLLFLRRGEWFGLEIVGNKLVIQSEKTSNGRGIGKERERNLKDWPRGDIQELKHLLGVLKLKAPTREVFEQLMTRLSARIAYACENLGVPRLCIYATRHVGMASAKRVMTPEQVAACAGHKTARTSTSRYARRRTGWKLIGEKIPPPTASTFARVQPTSRWARDDHMAARPTSGPRP